MWDEIDVTRFKGARVGVLFGGKSAEREISVLTGHALADALEQKGYTVTRHDLPADLTGLVSNPPDVVLLGLHGDGEDGTVQGLLEVLEVPYTGSGVLASALCMDKIKAKAVMAEQGVPLAKSMKLTRDVLEDIAAFNGLLDELDWVNSGYVIKPTDSGSSHGVFVLGREDDASKALAESLAILADGLGSAIMLEERLTGPEYSVGFFGSHCLGAIEITPEQGFYDFEAKYKSTTTRYTPLEGPVAAQIMAVATQGWEALGCRGVGRVDVMAHCQGDVTRHVVLEANTIPGMTATSLVPKLAARQGVAFPDFVEMMVAAATTDDSPGQPGEKT